MTRIKLENKLAILVKISNKEALSNNDVTILKANRSLFGAKRSLSECLFCTKPSDLKFTRAEVYAKVIERFLELIENLAAKPEALSELTINDALDLNVTESNGQRTTLKVGRQEHDYFYEIKNALLYNEPAYLNSEYAKAPRKNGLNMHDIIASVHKKIEAHRLKLQEALGKVTTLAKCLAAELGAVKVAKYDSELGLANSEQEQAETKEKLATCNLEFTKNLAKLTNYTKTLQKELPEAEQKLVELKQRFNECETVLSAIPAEIEQLQTQQAQLLKTQSNLTAEIQKLSTEKQGLDQDLVDSILAESSVHARLEVAQLLIRDGRAALAAKEDGLKLINLKAVKLKQKLDDLELTMQEHTQKIAGFNCREETAFTARWANLAEHFKQFVKRLQDNYPSRNTNPLISNIDNVYGELDKVAALLLKSQELLSPLFAKILETSQGLNIEDNQQIADLFIQLANSRAKIDNLCHSDIEENAIKKSLTGKVSETETEKSQSAVFKVTEDLSLLFYQEVEGQITQVIEDFRKLINFEGLAQQLKADFEANELELARLKSAYPQLSKELEELTLTHESGSNEFNALSSKVSSLEYDAKNSTVKAQAIEQKHLSLQGKISELLALRPAKETERAELAKELAKVGQQLQLRQSQYPIFEVEYAKLQREYKQLAITVTDIQQLLEAAAMQAGDGKQQLLLETLKHKLSMKKYQEDGLTDLENIMFECLRIVDMNVLYSKELRQGRSLEDRIHDYQLAISSQEKQLQHLNAELSDIQHKMLEPQHKLAAFNQATLRYYRAKEAVSNNLSGYSRL